MRRAAPTPSESRRASLFSGSEGNRTTRMLIEGRPRKEGTTAEENVSPPAFDPVCVCMCVRVRVHRSLARFCLQPTPSSALVSSESSTLPGTPTYTVAYTHTHTHTHTHAHRICSCARLPVEGRRSSAASRAGRDERCGTREGAAVYSAASCAPWSLQHRRSRERRVSSTGEAGRGAAAVARVLPGVASRPSEARMLAAADG